MTPAQKQHQLQVAIAFAMVYVLWGSTFLAIGIAVKHMPPTMMGATRFLISGSAMLAICLFTRRSIRITMEDFWKLALIGVLLLTGGNVVVGWAEKYVPTGLAALILSITPIWVAIVEAWILRSDRLSWRGVLGLVLGTTGLLVLLWPKLHATTALGRMQLLGCIALIFAALSWTCGSILSRRSSLTVGPIVATGWEMAIAGTVNFLLALGLGDVHKVDWNMPAVLSITYLVIGGSLLGFTAYIWLLEHVPTAKVATYAYVNPIVAVILGAVVLHEKIDAYIVVGSAVIVAGVILVTTSKIRPGEASLPAETQLPACEAEA